MPIEAAIWKVSGDAVSRIELSVIDTEQRLEGILHQDISILGDDYLVLGRQVRTTFGKIVDLLAINETGKLTVIELKKDRTPREVVAQVIDYASWVATLSYRDISEIFKEKNTVEFEEAFAERFGTPPPEKLNQEHDMLIVCSELDNETERIINYLSDNYSVPVNAVFLRFFKDHDAEYLSRSWLIDPTEVEEKSTKATSQKKGEAWNGHDFVVNIDTNEDGTSTWEDSLKYGFVSAGGGKWYMHSLKQLSAGSRIFAMIPKKGYLGVANVKEECVPIKDFKVGYEGRMVSIMEVPLKADFIKKRPDDLEKCEYLVRVEWIKTLPEDQAYWEKGLRANQNSAFKLKNAYTLNKLVEFFDLDD